MSRRFTSALPRASGVGSGRELWRFTSNRFTSSFGADARVAPRPASRRSRVHAAAALLVLVPLLAADVARAAAYEGFDYPVGTMQESLFGGFGWRDYWRYDGNQPPSIVAGSLSDPTGTLLTTGNHVRRVSQYALTRPLTERPGVAGGEFWVSFLIRREGPQYVGFSGLILQTGAAGENFFIGEPGSGPGDHSLVISNGSDPIAAASGVPFEAGRDYFLVARFQIGEGNDPATLWVNPTPGVAPGAGGVTFSNGNFGTAAPFLRLTAAVPDGVVTRFDEVRAGASYAEVAPIVPEPGTALGTALVALWFIGRRRGRAGSTRHV